MGHRVVEIKTRCASGRIGNLLKPTFKGSERPCRFFGLRVLHTTRSRGPVRHRPGGDEVGHQQSGRPLAHLSI